MLNILKENYSKKIIKYLIYTIALSGFSNAISQSNEPINYPNKTIRVVVPFTPGGGTDAVGRTLVDSMSKDLKTSMIIDNKPGGGTVIGTDIVAKAPADGYTLLLTTSAIAINDSLVKKLPYKNVNDLTEIGLIASGPNVFVVNKDSPFNSIKDIIDYASKNPGKVNYGSSGNGSGVHLATELFKLMSNIDITHVPYKGASPAYNDLMGGQIDFVVATAAGVAKLVEAGKLKAIAVTSAKRSDAYKGVPTVAETLPGYEAEIWYALFAPKNTPRDIVNKLNTALNNAAQSSSYKQRLQTEGFSIKATTPEEMTKLMREEEERWKKVVIDGKVSID